LGEPGPDVEQARGAQPEQPEHARSTTARVFLVKACSDTGRSRAEWRRQSKQERRRCTLVLGRVAPSRENIHERHS